MPEYELFTGLPAKRDADRTGKWARLLVTIALAFFVVGAVLAAILWFVDADVGALTLSIAFAGLVGFMVLRQALLAERR